MSKTKKNALCKTNERSAANELYEKLAEEIRSKASGTIFSIGFIKRTNGEFRHILCRFMVKKHLKGGKMAYRASDHKLLTVYDVANKGYRTVPLENILWIRIRGRVWRAKKFLKEAG